MAVRTVHAGEQPRNVCLQRLEAWPFVPPLNDQRSRPRGQLDSEKYPQIYLTKGTHARTLWCYLRTEEPRWRDAVTNALKQWQRGANFSEQHGTSNTASPAHAGRRATATPRNGGGPGSSRGGRSSSGLAPASLYGGGRLSAVPEGSAEGADSERRQSTSSTAASTHVTLLGDLS